MNPFLSVIIPAYNEENRIGPTLESVGKYLSGQTWSSEVIVVSDGSKDRTVEVATSFQQTFPFIKVLANEINQGKGAAVRQGMLVATGECRLFMDADNSTQITEIQKLQPNLLPKHCDVVISSLWVEGARVIKPEFFLRTIAGRIGNWLIRFLLLPGIKDTQRGFKLFTAKAAEDIFSKLRTNRWGFDIEALALGRKLGYTIKEVPVNWTYSQNSKVRVGAYIEVLREVIQIWQRLKKEFPKT